MSRPEQSLAGGSLAVLHLAERSGPSVSLHSHLRWLSTCGRLDVVVPGPGRVAEEYGRFAEVTIGRYSALTMPAGPLDVPGAARGFVREVRGFRALIRARRPARVVVVTTSLPAALVAANAERVPALVYAGEVIRTGPGPARMLGGAALRRLVCSRADALACNSRLVASQFSGPGAPPLEVVYPVIEEALADADGPGFRRRLGIPEDARCAVTLGALSPGRGQDVIVRALPELLARFPDLRLVIVGDPHPRAGDVAFREELVALATELGVAEAVILVPHLDRPGDAFAAADVVVNAAHHEAFGRVAAEALVAGCPVVSTDVEGIPEVLRNGVDALLVPPGDPGRLAESVTRVLEDGALARRLVESGSARVRSEFTEANAHERFEAAVRALDGRRPDEEPATMVRVA